jgi:hypothetical protein
MRSLSKAVAVAALVAVVPTVLAAQARKPAMKGGDGIFEKGASLVSVGLLTGGDGNQGTGVGGQFEYGLMDFSDQVKLGIGGAAGYTRKSIGGFSYTAIPIYGMANAHFVLPDQPALDLYAGVSVGFTRFSVPSVTIGGVRAGGGSLTESGFGIQGGGRYKISDALSVHAQIGLIDIPLFHAGVTFKM